MGLHRALSKKDDLIAHEIGKRTFWTIRLLANYLAAASGMPRLLDDENVDQDMPMEANDTYISKTEILPQPAYEVCEIAGMNAYITLHRILERVVRHIYPFSGTKTMPAGESVSYLVSVEQMSQIEQALKDWKKNLPFGFRLSTDPAYGSVLR